MSNAKKTTRPLQALILGAAAGWAGCGHEASPGHTPISSLQQQDLRRGWQRLDLAAQARWMDPQWNFRGEIVDASSGDPVPGAHAWVLESGSPTTSQEVIPSWELALQFAAPGYVSESLAPRRYTPGDYRFDVGLQPSMTPLRVQLLREDSGAYTQHFVDVEDKDGNPILLLDGEGELACTDASGIVDLRGLPNGAVHLRVWDSTPSPFSQLPRATALLENVDRAQAGDAPLRLHLS